MPNLLPISADACTRKSDDDNPSSEFTGHREQADFEGDVVKEAKSTPGLRAQINSDILELFIKRRPIV